MLVEDIARGESDQLEFKEVPNRDSSKWLKTVVAFANCRGGRIVFGVTNERKVVGIRGDIFAAKDAIADAVASACTPPIPIEMCVSTIEGKPVIVVEVAAGRQTPYFIKAKGEVDGTYVRFDATTRLADEMALKSLRVDGSGKGYDEACCRGLEVSDADVEKLCQRMHQVALGNASNADERKLIKPVRAAQLVKWGVLRPSRSGFVATNAYALLVGSDLFAPAVKCAVFRGETRSVFLDRRQFGGPVDEQIENAYMYVLSKINLGSVFGEGIRRKDVYEIPPSAIREIIVNAVAHRNYVNGEESPITVALYDDRLEVTSPGKLPNGITVAKMLDGCSECRNKALAQALAYMNIIEDWGSGIPRICGDLKDAGFKGLEIIPWPNAVRIVIRRRKNENTWRQSRPKGAKEGAKEGAVSCRILSAVEGTSMSARQIAETLGVRPTTRSFRLALAALLDGGLLESTCGNGKRDRRQKYRMTEKGQKIVHSLQDENKV